MSGANDVVQGIAALMLLQRLLQKIRGPRNFDSLAIDRSYVFGRILVAVLAVWSSFTQHSDNRDNFSHRPQTTAL